MEGCGFEVRRGLMCLEPVLMKWTELTEMMGRRWRQVNDAPWWYNERASVSTLAGAVWCCGGYAFEEYSERKKAAGGGIVRGRVDIAFSAGKHEFVAEAKQCWPRITAKRSQVDYMRACLTDARNEVLRAVVAESSRLAIVFAGPRVRVGSHVDVTERVNWFIGQARAVKADAMAWVFPDAEHAPADAEDRYVGGLLLIDEVEE